MNKKYNIVLFLLFIVYLFGYFSISKTLVKSLLRQSLYGLFGSSLFKLSFG